MDEIDKEALTRVLELTKAEPERAGAGSSVPRFRSWEEVGRFAARHQQCKSETRRSNSNMSELDY